MKILFYLLVGCAFLTTHLYAETLRITRVAKPNFQAIYLDLDPSKDEFQGKVNIDLTVIKPTKFIEMSHKDYEVKIAKISSSSFHCDLKAKPIFEEKIQLVCDKPIPVGDYSLFVDYKAPYNRHSVGLYKTEVKGVPFLFTQFEAIDARKAIPLFDEPEYKIPFQMTIKAPAGQKVFANTPIIKTIKKDKHVVHYFAKTKPLPSYLLALTVGPLAVEKVEGMNVPGNIIAVKDRIQFSKFAKKEMPRMLGALEEYFAYPYPYKKLDSVSVPEFPYGAMENAGLVTYSETRLLINPDNLTLSQKASALNTMTHELAHQWYGNLVTMEWWNDLWLNEAFATWMATKITQKLYPELKGNLYLRRDNAMSRDALSTTKPIRKTYIKTKSDIWDGGGLAYSKGGAVLAMVENWIGEEAFRNGIRSYMKKYAFKNTVADDLWGALKDASGKDVPGVLKSFIEQSSFPLVSVKNNGNKLLLSQKRYRNLGDQVKEQLWKIPMVVRYGATGKKPKVISFLMDSKEKQVVLEYTPEWIFPDQNATGYYRWVLDTELTKSLQHHSQEILSDRENLSLLAQGWGLLKSGNQTIDSYLETTIKLLQHENPRIASVAWSYLSSSRYLFEDVMDRKRLGAFVVKYGNQVLKRIGNLVKSEEDPDLSAFRAKVLVDVIIERKDQDAVDKFTNNAKVFINSGTGNPYMLSAYLRVAAHFGSEDLYRSMRKEFENTSDPKKRLLLLRAMNQFKNPKVQTVSLDYILSDQITSSDLFSALSSHGYDYERYQIAKKWVLKNYEKLKVKMSKGRRNYLVSFIAEDCNEDTLKEAKQFFGPKSTEIRGYKRSLSKLEDRIHQCVKLKNRHVVNFKKFVDGSLM